METQCSQTLLWTSMIIQESEQREQKSLNFTCWGFPGGSMVKKKKNPAKVGDTDSIPESERCPGERNGNPLQYSCLGHSTDRGAWWAIVRGITKEPDKT